jgi:hypothetical protein
MNLVEMSSKLSGGSREHLITFEVEGERIEDEDVTFRVSIKNLQTGVVRRSQYVIQPCREDSDDCDD